jgi:hypothetical protein
MFFVAALPACLGPHFPIFQLIVKLTLFSGMASVSQALPQAAPKKDPQQSGSSVLVPARSVSKFNRGTQMPHLPQ